MIYFISDGTAIKIGRARDVAARVKELQCGSSRVLSVLGTTDGHSAHESKAHKDLAEYRLGGEWFQDCEAVRDAIAGYIESGILVDAVTSTPEGDSEILAKCRAAANLLVKNEMRNGHSKMAAYSRVAEMIGATAEWMRAFCRGRGEPRFSEGLAILQRAHSLASNSSDRGAT